MFSSRPEKENPEDQRREPACHPPLEGGFLRRRQLGARLGGPSLPLDVGVSTDIHQVTIHQQGWTVVLNPDGTTTAWNKDKSKVLHSHSPPARPG